MKKTIILFSFVFSSLALVDARHNNRVLHTKKEEFSKELNRIKSEIASNQVVLTELSRNSKIMSTAVDVLKMRQIKNSDTVFFRKKEKP
jgi:cell division protein FtsL